MPIEYRKTHFPVGEDNPIARTRYTAYQPESGDIDDDDNFTPGQDLAVVEVQHHPQTPFTHRGGISGTNTVPGVRTHSDSYPPTSLHTVRGQKDKWGDPVQESVPMLFKDFEARPHDKLSVMSSAHGHGKTAMSLMALAHKDSRESNTELIPDSNLTKHSLRIVRHLASLGMVHRGDVPKRASVAEHTLTHLYGDRFGWLSHPRSMPGMSIEAIDPADVRNARNDLAKRTRFARQQKQSRKKQSMEGQPTIFD